MGIKIKAQKDYLLTEVSIELPTRSAHKAVEADCILSDLDILMRATKGTGKIVAIYQQGGMTGVNFEQRTHIREDVASKVRSLVGVHTVEIDGQS